MGAVLGNLARGIYAIALVSNMLWTTALMNVVNILPMRKTWRQGVCLVLVQLGWRISLIFAPWINCKGDDDYVEQWGLVLSLMAEYDEESDREGVPRRPLFILANHTSFLDTILGVCKFPINVIWRVRTYMDSNLFKMPVLHTVCKSVGHFPVYFTSTQDGVFKVDVARMDEVEKLVDAHLKSGWLTFFPEGQMNGKPDKILPFRFGGMKKALETDARMVMLVFRGNPAVWPRKATVGGYPGTVRYSLRPYAMDGAKSFVEMARAEAAADEKDLADHEILARRSQELMQSQYDALGSDKKIGIGSLEALSKLLSEKQKKSKKS